MRYVIEDGFMLSSPHFSFLKLVYLFSALAITSSSLSARVFTNAKGNKINAKIVSVTDDKVTLKLIKNKKEYTLGINDLSADDQTYIQEWSKKNTVPLQSKKDEKKDPTNEITPLRIDYSQFAYATLKEKYKLSDNFDEKWPTLASADIPDITIVEENDEKKKYVYHSNSYEFICDVKLSKNVVNKFAHLFEATKVYCQAMPLSMLKAHIPKNGKKYKILLFETEESYLKNGGSPGSAGVYMPGKDIIMVPLPSLGVIKSGSGYRYDYKGSNNTLPHEITHQLTNQEYYAAGGWFTEGLAEYVAMTDYRSGKFMARGNLKDIKNAVTGFSKKTNRGKNIGTDITAPDLKSFMTMPYDEFTANGNFNYGLGTLITYYFLHLEDDRSRVNAFLVALNEGKKGEEALKVLLNGQSYDDLEKLIFKAWKKRGVKINFR